MGTGSIERRIVLVAVVAAGAVALVVADAVAQAPGTPSPCGPRGPLHLDAKSWPRSRTVMAPAGVSALRLCRYAGLGARPRLKLRRSVLVADPTMISTLVGDLNALRPIKGAFSCPTSDGSQVLALLAYANGQTLTISIGTAGCGIVTNGNLVRTIANLADKNPVGPRLARELKRLVGADYRYRRR